MPNRPLVTLILFSLGAGPSPVLANEKKPPPSAIDRIVAESSSWATAKPDATPGSIYASTGRLADLTRDVRALHIGDLVTILVADRASAVSRGGTNANRSAHAASGIRALGGVTGPASPLANLTDFGSDTGLQSQAETSRQSILTTALTARVTHVLPNGNLVIEGSKDITINSERQRVTVRGIARWNDLTPLNRLASDRLAEMEILVNGRGVVNDSIRRPGFLYRLLVGLLTF
jgi:flagellar L-ring protein precursor FlgH